MAETFEYEPKRRKKAGIGNLFKEAGKIELGGCGKRIVVSILAALSILALATCDSIFRNPVDAPFNSETAISGSIELEEMASLPVASGRVLVSQY